MPFKGERVKKWKGEKMANATNVFGFASFISYSFSLFHLFKVDKFVAKHLFALSPFHLFKVDKFVAKHLFTFSPFHLFKVDKFVAKHLFTLSLFHLFKVDKFVAKHLFTFPLFHLFTFPLEVIRKHRVVVRQHDWRLCGHL